MVAKLLILLASVSWGQSTGTLTEFDEKPITKDFDISQEFQKLETSVRALEQGRPVLTSSPTFRGSVDSLSTPFVMVNFDGSAVDGGIDYTGVNNYRGTLLGINDLGLGDYEVHFASRSSADFFVTITNTTEGSTSDNACVVNTGTAVYMVRINCLKSDSSGGFDPQRIYFMVWPE